MLIETCQIADDVWVVVRVDNGNRLAATIPLNGPITKRYLIKRVGLPDLTRRQPGRSRTAGEWIHAVCQ